MHVPIVMRQSSPSWAARGAASWREQASARRASAQRGDVQSERCAAWCRRPCAPRHTVRNTLRVKDGVAREAQAACAQLAPHSRTQQHGSSPRRGRRAAGARRQTPRTNASAAWF